MPNVKEPCPKCGSGDIERHVWGNGATSVECPVCGYTDEIPPSPEVSNGNSY